MVEQPTKGATRDFHVKSPEIQLATTKKYQITLHIAIHS